MCEARHEIIIKNLYNNEIITNEILLISGVVSKRCHVSEIYVHEKNSNIGAQSPISKSGEFKIIWQLIEGRNDFEFSYCRQSIEIGCDFKENNTDYKIQSLYLICREDNEESLCEYQKEINEFEKESLEKITLGLKLVQCLYSEKLIRNGRGRRTFAINSDCVPFYSKLSVKEARSLDQNSLWLKFASEILNSPFGANPKLKFVAFIGCTLYEGISDGDYSYENIREHTKATASLGGGGLALFGTGCLYTWPSSFNEVINCFENDEKVDLERCMDDSNYRRTFGGCFATTLGAVCHEIGHILDLGHSEDGIMGNGFDYVNRVFTIDNLTEDLPERIIKDKFDTNEKDQRLTRVKKTNSFLQKYHEQKTSDSTFFTPNCQIILKFHKWLNNYKFENVSKITLDQRTYTIHSTPSFLAIVEIRTKFNCLVLKYFDLTQQNTRKFSLSYNFDENTNDYHQFNIFVMTTDGSVQLFE